MTGRNIASKVLTLLSFAAAGLASYYLFFVPALEKRGGILISSIDKPAMETAWQHFAFWPPLPDTPADPWVFVIFTIPMLVTLLALVAAWNKQVFVKMVLLWGFWVILLVPTILLFLYYDGPLVFLPSAILLLTAAIIETVNYLRKRGVISPQTGLETATHQTRRYTP